MKIFAYGLLSAILMWFFSPSAFAGQTVVAAKVNAAPVIDGRADDQLWRQGAKIITHDRVADIDVALRAVYTEDRIFFLVRYSDPDESSLHKCLEWNREKQIYEIGPNREDTFVFKWNMKGDPVDLRVISDQAYTADIWYWKARRTNPAGFADDKFQTLTFSYEPKSMKVISHSGREGYLLRRGDAGRSAYRPVIKLDYEGDRIPQYKNQVPLGSRADIQSKGVWSEGQWTIEFSRALTTGHSDDVQFDTSQKYYFGISKHEIAGRKPDPHISQPLYGSGDVTEELFLVFAP